VTTLQGIFCANFWAKRLENPEDNKKHAVIALHGRFKNELGEKCHLMPLVRVTNSGLMPAKWITRMLEWYTEAGITRGPVFRGKTGMRAQQSLFCYSIWSRLVAESGFKEPPIAPRQKSGHPGGLQHEAVI
jgi:hypothetical protein